MDAPRLHFYASQATLERANRTFSRDLSGHELLAPESEETLNLKIRPVEPLNPFQLDSYRVIAFPANHAHGLGAMLFAIERNGSSIFYLLVTPLLAQPSVPIGEKRFEVLRDAFGLVAQPFSITGQPAIALPIFWNSDNLPISVQIVADLEREDILLRIASQLEELNPWRQHWPTPVESLA